MSRRRAKGSWLPALAVVLAAWVGAPAPAAAYDPAAWRADYQTLKDGLQRDYANLAWFGSPQGGIDLPSLDRQTRAALDAARSDDEARHALRAFIDGFHDGHLQVLPPDTRPIYVPADQAPVDMSGDGRRVCERLGYRAPSNLDFSLPFASLPGFAVVGGRPVADYGLAVAEPEPGLKVGLIRLPSFWMKHYPALCASAWAALRAQGGPVAPDDLERETDWAFAAAVAADLRRLDEIGVRAVLADLGGNGGGDETGDLITRLFTARPIPSARLWATPPAARAYLEDEITLLGQARDRLSDPATRARFDAAIAAHQARLTAVAPQTCDLSWVWRERRPWNPRVCSGLVLTAPVDPAPDVALYQRARLDPLRGAWRGPVYVLIDHGSASSAEMFASLLRDHGLARLVGQRSYGAGCGNVGDLRFIDLPHAQMRVKAPDCLRQRADGSSEVEGLAPDLPLADGAARDRARRALELIAGEPGKIAAGRGARARQAAWATLGLPSDKLENPMADLEAGASAPDFELAGADGPVRLADFKGKALVLYFYPKDDTTGCTREAQDFTALAGDFAKAGVAVLGVSKDTVAKHAKFVAKYDLGIPLGSDPEGVVIAAYGSWVEKTLYGRQYMGIDRSTFLIDKAGKLARIWRKVKVPGHAAEVLKAAQAL